MKRDRCVTELGEVVENLSALTSGDPVQMLGMTITGLARQEAGDAKDVLPFRDSPAFGSLLEEDDIPPLLAIDDTSMKLRPRPFSFALSTDVRLPGEFSLGHVELAVGDYSFLQALLGISDEGAVAYMLC